MTAKLAKLNTHQSVSEFPLVSDVNQIAEVFAPNTPSLNTEELTEIVFSEMQNTFNLRSANARTVAVRIADEVGRICQKSNRIQTSGDVANWQLSLARHRLQKSWQYYKLGSKQGRVELHSLLASMVYRHIAPSNATVSFSTRYNLIEDFLQGFYIESLRAFRREHQLDVSYTPNTQLELAEYLAFSEQYAKRQIGLASRHRQRLIILRAQSFAKGQPPETLLDIEMAVESAKTEEAQMHNRSSAVQQVREQMVSEAIDPADAVLRERVLAELIQYLEAQGQTECIAYLQLKLDDLQACDIDKVLGLTPRQRDYLQQKFKYHVERFTRSQNWQLVHQWLGADIDQKLGLKAEKWEIFYGNLTDEQKQILQLKRSSESDQAIAEIVKCTPKQVQKRWSKILDLAWTYRNEEIKA
ncbi:MAG: HetZ-related protein [Microcoleaceae cyanobacterium]